MKKQSLLKRSAALQSFVCILMPAVFYLLLDRIYTFPRSSAFALAVYTACALCAVLFAYKVTKKKNRSGLAAAFAVFVSTFLSVYPLGLILKLNLPLFDFIKGADFALICFGLCYMTVFLLGLLKSIAHKAHRIFSALHYLMIFLSLLLPFVFIGYYVGNLSVISSDIILALAQTNGSEIIEFIFSNISFKWGLSFLCLVFLYLVNCRAFAFAKEFPVKKTADDSADNESALAQKYRLKRRRKLRMILSFLATLCVFVFYALPRLNYLPYDVLRVTQAQLDNYRLYRELQHSRLERLESLKSLYIRRTDGADDHDSGKKGSLFVLVIGESESASRMHAYGYKRPTTPQLERDLLNENNILYTNVYSCWPQTVQALSYALTGSSQYEKGGADAASVVEAAKASGFKTYWLSNQRRYGIYETPVTVISSSADETVFTNGSANMESAFFDEELLKRIPEFDENEDCLVIFHLMGSHQRYSNRLPSEYFVFSSEDETDDLYDDTILYTDYVVSSIYRKLSEHKNFRAMLYFSDHGEDPHVTGGHDPDSVNLEMLHVPMVVYLSESFAKDRKQTFDSLVRNRDRYFSNDLVFDTMIHIMGIEGLPGQKREYSLGSDTYRIERHSLKLMDGKSHIQGSYLVNN